MTHPFHPFTGEHYAALAAGLVAMVGFLMAGKKGGASQHRATALLALMNFAVYPLSLAAWSTVAIPKSIDNFLPLHMCDIAAITAGFALVTRRPLLCAITYFWGLAATSISTKNGKLELENYGQEPVRLTSITEEQKKK